MRSSDGYSYTLQVIGYLVNIFKVYHSPGKNLIQKNTVLKPTLVDLLNKLRLRENHVEGTRQITSVTSEKGGHGVNFF